MNVDLLEILQSAFGEHFVRDISAQLGESELSTHTALRCAGPALMSGLMQRVTAPGGASEVFRQITDPQIDPGAAGKFQGMLANRSTFESLLKQGQSIDQKIFGPRTSAVTHALAESSGIRNSSAFAILSLTAPLLFGLLKKHAQNNDLDANSLATLLLRQHQSVGTSGLDHRVAGALGFGSVAEMLATFPLNASAALISAKHGHGLPARRVSERSWLPWSAAAAVAIFGVMFLVNRTAEQQELPHGAVKIAEVESAPAVSPERKERNAPVAQTESKAASDEPDAREAARERTRNSREDEASVPTPSVENDGPHPQ